MGYHRVCAKVGGAYLDSILRYYLDGPDLARSPPPTTDPRFFDPVFGQAFDQGFGEGKDHWNSVECYLALRKKLKPQKEIPYEMKISSMIASDKIKEKAFDMLKIMFAR